MIDKKLPTKAPAGNVRLKLERERRGWSLSHVATLIGCPDPNTVGRWERNLFLPSPRYRRALCELYGKNAQELGFLSPGMDKDKDRSSPGKLISYREHQLKDTSLTVSPSCFFFNVRLPHPLELFGRKAERDILFHRLQHHSSTSLVGPRRIGKTWLLHSLLFDAKKQLGNQLRIGYVDAMLDSCSTRVGFIVRAAKSLGFSLSLERASQGLMVLEEIVDTLHSKGLHVALCIDEFEYMCRREDFDLNFFASLRALAQSGLSLIIASKIPIVDMLRDFGDKDRFFNIFEHVPLNPFNQEEAETFVRAKATVAHFTDHEKARLLQYGQLTDGQWLPLRLQLVGKMLLEEKVQREKNLSDPHDVAYWRCFNQRLEEKYRSAIIQP